MPIYLVQCSSLADQCLSPEILIEDHADVVDACLVPRGFQDQRLKSCGKMEHLLGKGGKPEAFEGGEARGGLQASSIEG